MSERETRLGEREREREREKEMQWVGLEVVGRRLPFHTEMKLAERSDVPDCGDIETSMRNIEGAREEMR